MEWLEWLEWLLIADKLRLECCVGCCVPPVVNGLLGGGYEGTKQSMGRLAQLSQPASSMLLAALVKGTIASAHRTTVARYLPSRVDCRGPADYF